MQIIVKHPWSSLRDALLISAFMTFVVLIARHYDIFTFFASLADPAREISPAEAVLLAILFALALHLRPPPPQGGALRRRLPFSARARDARVARARDAGSADEAAEPARLARRARCGDRQFGACGQTHAFFIMDLNGFKCVNDAHGHAVGDHVLQVVVERFRRVTRPSDLLARLGGDEFAVLSCNVDRNAAWSIGARFAAPCGTRSAPTGTRTTSASPSVPPSCPSMAAPARRSCATPTSPCTAPRRRRLRARLLRSGNRCAACRAPGRRLSRLPLRRTVERVGALHEKGGLLGGKVHGNDDAALSVAPSPTSTSSARPRRD